MQYTALYLFGLDHIEVKVSLPFTHSEEWGKFPYKTDLWIKAEELTFDFYGNKYLINTMNNLQMLFLH